MYSVNQSLFETYGEAVLRERNCGFDREAFKKWLRKFPLDEETLIG